MTMNNKRVWFITGASKGIGRSLVKQLLAQGERVAATSRNVEALIDSQPQSPDFLPLAVDLTSDASVAAAVQQVVDQFGTIDVVVNNAGYGIGGSIEELTDEEVADVEKLIERIEEDDDVQVVYHNMK